MQSFVFSPFYEQSNNRYAFRTRSIQSCYCLDRLFFNTPNKACTSDFITIIEITRSVCNCNISFDASSNLYNLNHNNELSGLSSVNPSVFFCQSATLSCCRLTFAHHLGSLWLRLDLIWHGFCSFRVMFVSSHLPATSLASSNNSQKPTKLWWWKISSGRRYVMNGVLYTAVYYLLCVWTTRFTNAIWWTEQRYDSTLNKEEEKNDHQCVWNEVLCVFDLLTEWIFVSSLASFVCCNTSIDGVSKAYLRASFKHKQFSLVSIVFRSYHIISWVLNQVDRYIWSVFHRSFQVFWKCEIVE